MVAITSLIYTVVVVVFNGSNIINLYSSSST